MRRLACTVRNATSALAALLALGCSSKPSEPTKPAATTTSSVAAAPKPFRAAIVLDVGGVDDKSFNESAYKGLLRAKEKLGIEVQYYQPSQPADRKTGLRQYASKGYDVVIGIGFIFSDEVIEMAKDFPDVKFGVVDMIDKPADQIPANVVGLKFKEEQASFLVGAVAALKTKSKKVGFIGGMNVPLIHKFEAGFKAGVAQIDPKIDVVVNYAGETPKAFQDPETGKNRAVEQYKSGVDIIYHGSGKTGLGVFQAAKELDRLAIGCDADQWAEAPGHVLTSMVKGVDVAVFDTIAAVKDGKFASGLRVFGLAESGVSIVYDEHNKAMVGEDVYQKVVALSQDIVAGKIVVPATR